MVTNHRYYCDPSNCLNYSDFDDFKKEFNGFD